MPEISRFFGIVIQMYYNDHEPPHFHVRYSGQRALIAIGDLSVLGGELTPRALSLVREWAEIHRAELVEDWSLARAAAELRPTDSAFGVSMLKDIVSAQPLEGYQIRLRFEDGIEGTLDLASVLSFRGIFAPLREPSYFRQVRVDSDLGTVVWPNGADLDPDVLYSHLTGQPIVLEPAHNNRNG